MIEIDKYIKRANTERDADPHAEGTPLPTLRTRPALGLRREEKELLILLEAVVRQAGGTVAIPLNEIARENVGVRLYEDAERGTIVLSIDHGRARGTVPVFPTSYANPSVTGPITPRKK